MSDIEDYAAAALNKNPNMAGMTLNQRLKTLANDKAIQKLSQVMAQQWLVKANMLQKQMAAQQAKQPAAQQPAPPVTEAEPTLVDTRKLPEVDETIYQKYLVDFVNKTMFRGQMRYLDPESKRMVDQDIMEIVKFRKDPAKVTQLFMPLAQTAALSVMTTPGAMQAPQQTAGGPQTAKAQPGSSASDGLRTALAGMGINVGKNQTSVLRQFFEQESGDIRVNKTGNNHADALLELFGFLPQ